MMDLMKVLCLVCVCAARRSSLMVVSDLCWYGWTRDSHGRCTPVCESGCKHGECVGPDQCRCIAGYTGKTCNKDVNECAFRPCKYRCMNTLGSFKCYCLNGHMMMADGTCRNARTCAMANCQYGCAVMKGQVTCQCPSPGLRLSPDGRTCVDVDECVTGQAKCARFRKCVNTFGSYICRCHDGFLLQHFNGKYHCTDKKNLSICYDKPGHKKCKCKASVNGKGYDCKTVVKVTIEPVRPIKVTTAAMTTASPKTTTTRNTTPTTVNPTTVAMTTAAPSTTVTSATVAMTTVAPSTTVTSATVAVTTTAPTSTVTSVTVAMTTTTPMTTVTSGTVSMSTAAPASTATSATVAMTTAAPTSTVTSATVAMTTAAPTITVMSATVAMTTAAPTITVTSATVVMTTAAATTITMATTAESTTTLDNRIHRDTQKPRGDVHIPRYEHNLFDWDFDVELGNTAEYTHDDPGAGSVSCTFDEGLCVWMSDSGDFHWNIKDDPSGGRYLTAPEATGIRGARLTVPLAPPMKAWQSSKLCLSFRHRLLGLHIGSLQVFVRKGRSHSPSIWTSTGGHGWKHAHISLGGRGLDDIVLKAERRRGKRGEIGVDDLRLSRGACTAD